jgi:hypothetical protein
LTPHENFLQQRHPAKLPPPLLADARLAEPMMCGGDGSFDWGAVVPRIVNPTKIEIIELLCRERRPLSATRMKRLLGDDELTVGRLHYHCKTLADSGVLEVAGSTARGAANEVFYVLAPQE